MGTPVTTAGIGVDIGGTSTRVALVDGLVSSSEVCGTGILSVFARVADSRRASSSSSSNNRFPSVLEHRSWPTGDTRTLDELLDGIARAIRDLTTGRREFPTDFSIGMAIPGTLNESRDRVVRCVNVPFLEDSAIVEALVERVGRPVTLCTDADAATWAEYQNALRTSLEHSPSPSSEPRASARAIAADATRRDDGIWPRRFVHLRIGTGVACGVVIDGALVRLDTDRRTHPPFLVVDDAATATECRCGLRGCLESIASGRALDASARKLGSVEGISGLQTAWDRSLHSEHPAKVSIISAVELVRRAGEVIGTAIGLVADRFRADVVCLGGGVVANLPCLVECAIKGYQRSVATGTSTGKADRVPAPLLYKEGSGEVFTESTNPPESPVGKGRAKRVDRVGDGTSVNRALAVVTLATLGDEAGVIGSALFGARAVHAAT